MRGAALSAFPQSADSVSVPLAAAAVAVSIHSSGARNRKVPENAATLPPLPRTFAHSRTSDLFLKPSLANHIRSPNPIYGTVIDATFIPPCICMRIKINA